MNEVLIKYIQEEIIGGEQELALSAEDDLLNSGLIDSLGIMRLIAFVENKFEIKVPPQDMMIENFMSVEAISSYIERVRPSTA